VREAVQTKIDLEELNKDLKKDGTKLAETGSVSDIMKKRKLARTQ
jgi:hypothetical protein